MVVDVTKQELVSQLTNNVMSMLYKKKDGTESASCFQLNCAMLSLTF